MLSKWPINLNRAQGQNVDMVKLGNVAEICSGFTYDSFDLEKKKSSLGSTGHFEIIQVRKVASYHHGEEAGLARLLGIAFILVKIVF